jgi:hypothetical protein
MRVAAAVQVTLVEVVVLLWVEAALAVAHHYYLLEDL